MKGTGQPRRKGLPPATFLAGLLTQPESKEIDHTKSFFVVLFKEKPCFRNKLGECGEHTDAQASPYSEDRLGSGECTRLATPSTAFPALIL